jgi:methylmalonyl-CoA mutase
MLYEQRKHDGSLPIVGVNTFVAPTSPDRGNGASGNGANGANGARGAEGVPTAQRMELARSTEDEKRRCLERCRDFQRRHSADRPAMLDRLRHAALDGDNLFGVLMDAVRCCTLGEITTTLFEVGGRYRRSV